MTMNCPPTREDPEADPSDYEFDDDRDRREDDWGYEDEDEGAYR